MKGSIALILTTSVAVEAYNKQELVLQDPAKIGERVLSKRPHEYLREEDLPASLDYRDTGLMTMDLNQHIPVYCGSCWAHSAFSSIADRLKIQTKGKKRDIIPSVQALINCGDAGTCDGGDSNAGKSQVLLSIICILSSSHVLICVIFQPMLGSPRTESPTLLANSTRPRTWSALPSICA